MVFTLGHNPSAAHFKRYTESGINMDPSKVFDDGNAQEVVLFRCKNCGKTKYGYEANPPTCHRIPMERYERECCEGWGGSLDHIHW